MELQASVEKDFSTCKNLSFEQVLRLIFINIPSFRSLKYSSLAPSLQVLSQLVVYTSPRRFACLRRRCSTYSGVCGGGTWVIPLPLHQSIQNHPTLLHRGRLQ
jgi:hypothetical protein